MEEIASWMEYIWLRIVKREYERSRILEESNLHSTVYFHLRKLVESSKGKKTKLFVYSEMPFSTTMSGKGKRFTVKGSWGVPLFSIEMGPLLEASGRHG